ncbi:MAG: ATP-binding protein [Patescibacteria group bacterium]|nr:ATP-binding protein [Patescibacteria group bacterium]
MKNWKKHIWLFLIIISTGVLILYWLYDNYRVRRLEILSSEQESIQNQYASVINSYRLVSQTVYDEVLNSKSVVQNLERASSANANEKVKIRSEISKELQPVYNRLIKKNFKQLNLFLADTTSFINMYKPSDVGESAGYSRASIAQAAASKQYVDGFEEGKTFNGYRYIFPLFTEKEKFAGLAEVSVSFGTLQKEMNSLFPYAAQFLLKKNVVQDSVFSGDVRNFSISTINKDYFYEKEPEMSKRVDLISFDTIERINRLLKTKAEQKMADSNLFSDDLNVNSISYIVTLIPISNIEGKQVAYLAAYRQSDSIYFLKNDFYTRVIFLVALLIIIVLLTFYIYDRQRRLLEIGERLQIITTSMSEGIIYADKDKRVVFYNPAAENITGYPLKEAIGHKLISFMRLTDEMGKRSRLDIVNNVFKTGQRQSENKDIFVIQKDGDRIPLALTATPLMLGSEKGCLLVFRDITVERDIDKAKTEFVSLASHQLKTPLSAINWYTEMLMDGDVGVLNDHQKDFVKEILAGNQRMVKLVNSLLNVSRIDMGTLSVIPELVDLKEMVKSVVSEQEFSYKAKNQKLDLKIDETLPQINLDPNLMRIVIQNLISNAIKYTREEGQIEVKLLKQGVDVYMQVSDNGYGIPKKEQPYIFTKLFRADNVKSKKVEGTGLGLYVAKAVIEAFGGKIWFESIEDKGTTFYLTIPLAGVKKVEGTKGLESNT